MVKRIRLGYRLIADIGYSGTPFERAPRQEASPSGKATLHCKSKHNCMNFYP